MQAGEGEAKLDLTPGQFLNGLAGMPDTLADELSGEFVEADADVIFPLGGKDAETVLEMFLQRELFWLGKSLSRDDDVAHSGQDEGPHFAAVDVVTEAIPLILNAGQMVRLDGTFLEG